MILGIRRAAAALSLSLTFCGVLSTLASADLFHHVLPGEVDAMDTATGQPIMAPPIPYGHYAKDPLGHMASKGSMLHAKVAGLGHGGMGLGHGKGCKNCGDGGLGHNFGQGSGFGHGHGDDACGNCGGSGLFSGKKCGGCGGSGLLGHGGNGSLSGLGHGHRVKGVAPIPAGFASTGQHGSAQAGPSAQGAPISGCEESGCGLFRGHGRGCNACGGSGLFGGKGCGACGGHGLLSHGRGCGTPGCGDAGCGGGHGFGKGCSACGGKGCGLCAGLRSKLGALGHPKAALGGLLHHGPKVKYFVGPGGPVPITPGYVPYVISTRSPRDFFAFPPFTQ